MHSNNLTKAIENNYSDFFIEIAQLKGIEHNKEGNFKWVNNKGVFPSGIFDIKLDNDRVDDAVKEIVEAIKVGLLPKTIMTGPSTLPSDYEKYFNKFGLVKKYEAVGMAIKLEELVLVNNDDKDLKITRSDDIELLNEWCEIVCVNLFNSKDSTEDFYNTIKLTKPDNQFQCFVAKYKSRLVATSFLYMNKDTAGIYFVATDKEFRNKGIGKQITLAPVLYAKEKGYSNVILQASPLGEIVYKQLGFKEYSRLGRYQLGS